jgi:opacity protein-like surface antigen
MRLMSRAALVLAATLFAAPALHAQVNFSVSAGAAVPIGGTADGLKTGYDVTGSLGFKPPLAPIGLRIDGMLNSMDLKGATSGSLRLLAGTANLTLSGAGMPIPMGYLIGGVGMYNGKVTGLPSGFTSNSSTDFGFNIGAGLKFPLTGFSTFVEARLHIVNTEGESTKFVPITFGITF